MLDYGGGGELSRGRGTKLHDGHAPRRLPWQLFDGVTCRDAPLYHSGISPSQKNRKKYCPSGLRQSQIHPRPASSASASTSRELYSPKASPWMLAQSACLPSRTRSARQPPVYFGIIIRARHQFLDDDGGKEKAVPRREERSGGLHARSRHNSRVRTSLQAAGFKSLFTIHFPTPSPNWILICHIYCDTLPAHDDCRPGFTTILY